MHPDRLLRDPDTFQGRVEVHPFQSRVLENNALGDPALRETPIYLPPQAGSESLPVIYMLVGFTGRPHSLLETHPWKSGVILTLDRAMATGEMPPAIVVMPNGFTRYGGSQYVNSSAVGAYEDHVVQELVPWVDATFPAREGRRGIIGKSSGGFGALHLGMRHADLFGAVASISGDCHFEYSYATDFLPALRGLIPFDGDPARFLAAFEENHELGGDGQATLNLLAMSACYSPNPDSPLGFDLPIDPHTGARVSEVWERWLAFDPVCACEQHAEALRSLNLLHLEAGTTDEFHLQFGLRVLAQRLTSLNIEHCHEEFDGGHFGINERYVQLMPRLIDAISLAPNRPD
jgi:enterochelin esterase family protein